MRITCAAALLVASLSLHAQPKQVSFWLATARSTPEQAVSELMRNYDNVILLRVGEPDAPFLSIARIDLVGSLERSMLPEQPFTVQAFASIADASAFVTDSGLIKTWVTSAPDGSVLLVYRTKRSR